MKITCDGKAKLSFAGKPFGDIPPVLEIVDSYHAGFYEVNVFADGILPQDKLIFLQAPGRGDS